MLDSGSSVRQRLNGQCKTPEVILLAPEFISIPAIKVTENGYAMSSRSPLEERDVAIWLLLQSVLVVGPGYFVEAPFGSLENVEPPMSINTVKMEIVIELTFCIHSGAGINHRQTARDTCRRGPLEACLKDC